MKISNRLGIFELNDNSFFQVGYFLLILNQVLAQSQFSEMQFPSMFLKISRWMLIIYFMVIVIKNRMYPYSKKGLLWACFAFFSITEMLFFNGRLLLIILFLIVIGSYKSDMNSLINTHIKALTTGMIIVVISSLVGVLDTLGVHKEFDNITGFLFKQDNIRYALGFVNSNIIPITCLYLYLYILLKKKDEYKWYFDIFAIIINYIVFLLCGSRVCILLLFFAILLRIMLSISKHGFFQLVILSCILLLIGCLIFSLVLPGSSLYSTDFIKILDHFLTARITIMRNVLVQYPVTLFGYGEISVDNSVEYLVMDNGYIALFVMRGLIIGALFMIFLFMMIWNANKSRNPYLALFIVIMILANIVDNSILHYITFPIYVLSFNGIYRNKNREGCEVYEF